MTRKLDLAFPFPKYYQFALQGITGAMENISLVSWDEKYVQNELAVILIRLVRRSGQRARNVTQLALLLSAATLPSRSVPKESWATYVEQLWREDNS